MTKDIIQYIIVGIVAGLVIYSLFQFRKMYLVIWNIAEDTLKRPDENGVRHWSPTKLTMFSAWIVALWSYHYDLIKNGFNITAFGILVGVALGAKVTDAWSKKMNPLVQPPKEDEPKG